MDDDVRQFQRRRHIVALARQAQPAGNAQGFCLAKHGGGIAPAPLIGSHEDAEHVGSLQACQRPISTVCPFQRGEPPGQQHDRSPLRQTPGGRASRANVRRYAAGSNTAGSTPRGITRIRAGSVPCRATISSAMKRLAAITRSPRAITALYCRLKGRSSA